MPKIYQISCGYAHVLACLYGGKIIGWGKNAHYQLGFGNNTTPQATPVELSNTENVLCVSAGYEHSLSANSVESGGSRPYSWGNNASGELGLGDRTLRSIPTEYSQVLASEVIAGNNFSILTDRGVGINVCGKNDKGQLGLGDNTDRLVWSRLIPLPQTSQALKVRTSAASSHSFAITNDGALYGWGYNASYQVGDGTTTNVLSPKRILYNSIQDVACGESHTVALTKTGELSTWGSNAYGQIGRGTASVTAQPTGLPGISGAAKIACGANHTVVLMQDGTARVFGDNTYGQLGLTGVEKQTTPSTIPGVGKIRDIACGGNFTLLLMDDDTVLACGDNTDGQLGIEALSNFNPLTPVPYFAHTYRYMYQIGAALYSGSTWPSKVSDDRAALTGAQMKDLFAAAAYDLAPPEQVKALGKIKILAYAEALTEPTCKITAAASDRLVLPKNLIDTSRYEGINKATLTAALSGGAALKTIVTTDLNSYKTYKNGAWQDIGPTDLAAVAANGIDYANLPNIPRAAWDTLLSGVNKLGFAYLPTIAAVTDTCEVDELTLEVDLKGTWEMALPGTDYTYGYPDQSTLRVTIKTNGEYKINYAE